MTSIEAFSCDDLFKFNNVNLDALTETYNINFYLQYLAQWPAMFYKASSPSGQLMGYMMGKLEGELTDWHGHVTAITVGPQYRRLNLARQLMDKLEVYCDLHQAYFVDLFVRKSNLVAIRMYEKLGYVTYRRVLGYYSSGDGTKDEEDALDMRKSTQWDKHKKKMQPLGRDVYPDEL